MFLERKREAEVAERQGLARRTVIQTVWLLISLAGAIAATQFLIFGGDDPLLPMAPLTALLADTFVPPQFRQWVVKGVVVIAMLILMQVLFMVAFMFGSSAGRQKSGRATLNSRSKDPYEQNW